MLKAKLFGWRFSSFYCTFCTCQLNEQGPVQKALLPTLLRKKREEERPGPTAFGIVENEQFHTCTPLTLLLCLFSPPFYCSILFNQIPSMPLLLLLSSNASYSYSTLVKATKAFSRLLCFLKDFSAEFFPKKN